MFDVALEKLYHDKVSHQDLDRIADSNNQKELFKDFKDLFDATVTKLNEKIDNCTNQYSKRIEFLNSKLKENVREVQ